jgi:retron-type reverse transcriptase
MKRYGYLYPKITSFENLLLAANRAQKSKRFRPEVLRFNLNFETELLQLQTELQTQTYQPGNYFNFEIYDPKPRWISAAPYRDRVVHHALCTIIQPIFERSFISDTYANRIGYGTHRALERFAHFTRKSPYVFQADIRRYFPSINHSILKKLIRRKIKCPDTLWLIDRILENLYLSAFDHYVCEQLKPQGYLRYVDDFALFSNDRDTLYSNRQSIETYLQTELHLEIHPIKSQIFETRIGCNFVGFRVFPTHIRVRNSNLRRARTRIKNWKMLDRQNVLHLEGIQRSLTSWNEHLSHGNTYKLRQKIQETIPQHWLS